MKNIQISFAIILFTLLVSCKSQKQTTNTQPAERPQTHQGNRQGPPSIEELFKMDADGDGKLSKSEIKGPLLDQFSKIDTNGDNLLSKKEVENAPKPQRGQRHPRQ